MGILHAILDWLWAAALVVLTIWLCVYLLDTVDWMSGRGPYRKDE